MTRILLIVLLLFALGACASGPDPNLPRTPLAVLPLNFESPPDDHLIEGLELVRVELVRQLEEEGFEIATISLATAIDHWRLAVAEIGGLHDSGESAVVPEQVRAARAAMARRLMTDRAETTLLFASFVLRKARTWKTSASWDGVSQKIPIAQGHGLSRKDISLGGSITASSLFIIVYARDGRYLGEAYGGLEIQKRLEPRGIDINHAERIRWHYYDWVDRDDLFQDSEKIADAVELSLDQIAPMLRPQ